MKKRAILMDLDGTIYTGNKTIPGAKAWINQLQQKNQPHLFVTNNATRNHQQAQAFMCESHQIKVSEDAFYTCVDVLCSVLDREKKPGKQTAYVIGVDSLKHAVANIGYDIINSPVNHEVDIVVTGLYPKVTYDMLSEAALCVQRGALFVLSNPDIQYPCADGFVPGAGALGQLIANVSRKEPIVCGKPNPVIIEQACAKLQVSKDETVMLGDNLLTDIKAANRAGVSTILIETGVHSREDIAKLNIEPTWVVKDYKELASLWEEIGMPL